MFHREAFGLGLKKPIELFQTYRTSEDKERKCKVQKRQEPNLGNGSSDSGDQRIQGEGFW
jgi:hypothetical protein